MKKNAHDYIMINHMRNWFLMAGTVALLGASVAEADEEVRREVWLAESARLKLTVARQLEEGELDLACAALRAHIEAAVELVREAHKVCPYSNATRGNIDVTLTVV